MNTLFNRRRGFTLTEVLIAVALLGVIAAFTVPKVLNTQSGTEKKAIFRQALTGIQAAFTQSVLNGDLRVTDDFTLMKKYLNHVKACNPCSSGCTDGQQNRSGEPGFLLANGSTLCGFNNTFTIDNPDENISIDWNGPNKGTDTEGDDVMVGVLIYDSNKTMMTFTPAGPSQTLYNSLFN